MPQPEMKPLSPEETFQFACNPDVPCFNQCCRDLHQALTPYDVLCLRSHLGMTSRAFLDRYTHIYTGPSTGLPVASLRFDDNMDRTCPFLGPEGCGVYEARPSSCRIYPLARGLFRSREDGSLTEHFALVREPHCRGFEQPQTQTVSQWLDTQGLRPYLAVNDALMELIALKNRLHKAPLSPEHRSLAQLALYDLDTLKSRAQENQLPHVSEFPPPDPAADDKTWLDWSLEWIRHVLFDGRQQPTR